MTLKLINEARMLQELTVLAYLKEMKVLDKTKNFTISVVTSNVKDLATWSISG